MTSPYLCNPEQSFTEQDLAQMVYAMVSDDLSTPKYVPMGQAPPGLAPIPSSTPSAIHAPADHPYNFSVKARENHLQIQVPAYPATLLSAFQPSATPFANSPGQPSPHTHGFPPTDALTPRSTHSVLDNSPVSSPQSLPGAHTIWGAPSVSSSPGRPSPLGCELSHGLGSPPGLVGPTGYAEVLGNGVPGQEMFPQPHAFPAAQRFDTGSLGSLRALDFSTFTATAAVPATSGGAHAMASTRMNTGNTTLCLSFFRLLLRLCLLPFFFSFYSFNGADSHVHRVSQWLKACCT